MEDGAHVHPFMVTDALYQARGNPPLDKDVSFQPDRLCGNCSQRRQAAPAGKILTSQFGSWEQITTDPDGGRWLCLPCAWTYRAKDLRRGYWLVSTGGDLHQVDLTDLRDLLSCPIPPDVALLAGLSGKKIIAPLARWGHLATDSGVLTWTARHKRYLTAATTLREAGFPESTLTQDSPAYAFLTRLPYDQHEHVRYLWRVLAPVRADKHLLPLMLHLSRKAPR